MNPMKIFAYTVCFSFAVYFLEMADKNIDGDQFIYYSSYGFAAVIGLLMLLAMGKDFFAWIRRRNG